jgi:acetyl-CoA carboxylase beta subunit
MQFKSVRANNSPQHETQNPKREVPMTTCPNCERSVNTADLGTCAACGKTICVNCQYRPALCWDCHDKGILRPASELIHGTSPEITT